MRRIAERLVRERRAAIVGEPSQKSYTASNSEGDERGVCSEGHRQLRGRDLLSVLMRANMHEDVPETQRLTDEEVLARELPY